jgi:hypothetical protein
MRLRTRQVAVAAIWSAVAVVAMLALFQGDWSEYVVPLALWATAVFLLVLRWQDAAWLQGGTRIVAGRVVRLVGISCLGLFALCTAALIGYGRLSGCPIIGDPGGAIDFQNDDTVPLIVYPHGIASVRRVLAPGERMGWGYLASCGSSRRDEEVFQTIGAEYVGAWVYCREVKRGELDARPLLHLRRGDLGCTPSFPPAGPP